MAGASTAGSVRCRTATATVESILARMDGQIEALLDRGASAILQNVSDSDRASVADVVRLMPQVLTSARVTRVERIARCTSVHLQIVADRCVARLIIVWDERTGSRPWITALDMTHTQRRRIRPPGGTSRSTVPDRIVWHRRQRVSRTSEASPPGKLGAHRTIRNAS
jgi:hypothetical protein